MSKIVTISYKGRWPTEAKGPNAPKQQPPRVEPARRKVWVIDGVAGKFEFPVTREYAVKAAALRKADGA
jgi:hypothetical protein